MMMNGDLITTFKREELEDKSSYCLIDDLERGTYSVRGAGWGAKADDLGVMLERFSLVIGNEVMQKTKRVTDYFDEGVGPIQITLVKQPVEDAIYKELRRQAELEHELEWLEYYTDEDRLR